MSGTYPNTPYTPDGVGGVDGMTTRASISASEALAEIKELCEQRAQSGPDPRFQGQVWPSEVLGIIRLVRNA